MSVHPSVRPLTPFQHHWLDGTRLHTHSLDSMSLLQYTVGGGRFAQKTLLDFSPKIMQIGKLYSH